MKLQHTSVLFDTSVLVAALVNVHSRHDEALAYLNRALDSEIACYVSTHSLAELYAVLTRLPVRPRITPDTARQLIQDNVLSMTQIVDLDRSDYETVIEHMTTLNLTGGAIYDALHVRAAEKARIDRLLTMDRDFRRMPPDPPVELVLL